MAGVSEQRGKKLEIRIRDKRALLLDFGRAFVRSLPFTNATGGF